MPQPGEVISRWHHGVEGFNTSALEFFTAVETTLQEREAPVRHERVVFSESGILSAKREYLRLSYGRYSFDLGAASFGKDFFFSWWLVRRAPESALLFGCGGLLMLPVLFLALLKIGGAFVGPILFLILLVGAVVWLGTAQGDGATVIEDAILGMPVLGRLYLKWIKPTTYYSEDSRRMFEETVHRVVVSHVTALLTTAKLPPLSTEAAKVVASKPVI